MQAVLSIALLASCASMPAPEPQRTYDRVRVELLYPVTADVLASAGFKASPCRAGPVCLETSWSWRQHDGDVRGEARQRERRKYSVRFERPPVYNQYMLFLDLVVQERPAQGGEWLDRKVVPEEDPEYLQLLAEIDDAVWRLGGRDSRNAQGATATRSSRRTK